MNNKTIVTIIVAALVIAGGLYFYYRAPSDTTVVPVNTTNSNTTGGTQQQSQQNPNVSSGGRVVFSVKDAAANMSGITEVTMKVSKVDVHSSANGWVTVSTTPRTYNLLELNTSNESKLLADVNMAPGTYDQVRLTVDSTSVVTKSDGTKVAKLPSGELRVDTKLLVDKDQTSSVNFDFLADKSLHVTGNGTYIFAPVVKTESKSKAEVTIGSNNTVTMKGGSLDYGKNFGMDVDGSVKADFEIKNDAKLNIGSDNKIKVEL